MGRPESIFELLKEYIETFSRPVPISYDLLRLSDEHRKFDALIRRYWDNLHPLSRDIFTSFANEIQYLLHLVDETESKLHHNNEELLKIKETFEGQLDKFEGDFENRVTEGIATVTNRNFDLMDRENRVLKQKIGEIQKSIESKDELIDNLRNEISLLIDDSKEQEETAKLLEDNIAESITQYDSFTKQLDVFEDVMETLQNANLAAEKEIDTLASELEFKAELIDEVKETYQRSLALSEERYEALKEKIKEISPQIAKIHKSSKIIHQINSELKTENEKLRSEMLEFEEFANLRMELEDEIRFLQEKNNDLENEVDHLKADVEMMKIKSSQKDDILSGYKTIVYENKADTASIPVPKKQQYSLSPQPVKQTPVTDQPEHEKKDFPKITPIPQRKESKVEIPNPQPTEDQTDDKEDEDVKQIIKDVLMGKQPDVSQNVTAIPSPKKIDPKIPDPEKPKKKSKEKLLG
ncbi:MAG: hypothetical protein ACW99A_13955 [Candidatus Kariarchaeaceae archaeon]|jgi:hypothetical protein